MKKIYILSFAVLLMVGCQKGQSEAVSPQAATQAPQAQETVANKKPVAQKPMASSPKDEATYIADVKAERAQWIDTTKSKVDFVGEKMIGSHTGSFSHVEGIVYFEGQNFQKVDIQINMSEVTTDNDMLTGHLKDQDFFHVKQYPVARFKSTSFVKNDKGQIIVKGPFTLRGVTQTVSFPVELVAKDGFAKALAQFEINRKDFGIVYPGKPDNLIKDNVKISFQIQTVANSPIPKPKTET